MFVVLSLSILVKDCVLYRVLIIIIIFCTYDLFEWVVLLDLRFILMILIVKH